MFTEMIYEVDLRDRENGNSVETIYSGADSDEAYRIADHWNTEHGFARNDYESYDDLLFSASLKINPQQKLFADVYSVCTHTSQPAQAGLLSANPLS